MRSGSEQTGVLIFCLKTSQFSIIHVCMNDINQSLYPLPNIIMITSRKVRYGHAASKGDMSKGHTSSVRKFEGKRPLRRQTHTRTQRG